MLVYLRHLISHCRHAQMLLSVLVLALWFPAIHPGTINIDTPWLVVNNPILSDPSPVVIWRIFSDFSLPTRLILGAEYLPLRDLSVWLDHRLFGTDFRWHHAQSLLWYALACCTLLRILRLWFSPAIALLLAAGLTMADKKDRGFTTISNGKDFNGWKASENKDSWKINTENTNN